MFWTPSVYAHQARSENMYLVLAVILLRVTQNPITQATDVSEGGVALVS